MKIKDLILLLLFLIFLYLATRSISDFAVANKVVECEKQNMRPNIGKDFIGQTIYVVCEPLNEP